jgi:FG-GAP-like repeat
MAFQKDAVRFILLMVALVGTNPLALSAARAATFTIINTDGAGVGFNDTTAATPIGGNTGTTIGQQRLIAFQFAANIWGALVAGNVTIQVSASFAPLTCSSTSAILGSAGPYTTRRDFSGAPVAGTWYAIALANALNGSDLDPSNPDITAQFNGAIGTTCAFPNTWYYGLDAKPPGTQIDFITVLVHELGHGLGFLTLVDLASGAKALGFNDTFMLNLENHGASPPDYPSMTNAQRVTASTATGNLHWVGPHVQSWSGLLTAGTVGTHVRMFAPNPQQPGSSVSHWDTVLTPNQIMEPVYTQPLHHPIMELPLFRDLGWTILQATHDFNGDGKSDIVWRDGGGNIALWLMNGTAVSSSAVVGTVPSAWSIAGQRNFSSADVKYDFLWRDTSGNAAIWFMNGTQISSTAGIGNLAAWTVVGTADFNGDGIGDILWQDTSGNLAVWLMSDAQVSQSGSIGSLPSVWKVAGTGDFNGDGRADILFQNTSGALGIWFMNGTQILQVGGPPAAAAWTVVGTGDFNGDGYSDILWRDGSNDLAVWLMQSTSVLQAASLGNVGANWTVAKTGDFNSDGKSDILWRDTTGGNVAMWYMNGTAVLQYLGAGTVPLTWTIQGSNAD